MSSDRDIGPGDGAARGSPSPAGFARADEHEARDLADLKSLLIGDELDELVNGACRVAFEWDNDRQAGDLRITLSAPFAAVTIESGGWRGKRR